MQPAEPQPQGAPPLTVCPPKIGKDKQSMSKETARNLFIVSSMPALYQQLLRGISNYEQLAARILRQIKAAHAFRQTERVKELSRILIKVPIKENQLIGQYY